MMNRLMLYEIQAVGDKEHDRSIRVSVLAEGEGEAISKFKQCFSISDECPIKIKLLAYAGTVIV